MSLSVLRTDKREEIIGGVGFYPRAEIKLARLSSSSGLSRWSTVRPSFPPCDPGWPGARVSARPFCLPISERRRHPGSQRFRGSMAGLYAPLPTLRRRPHGRLRTARGRCGSLLLHRCGLSPHTPCRSPGALTRVAARTLAPSPIRDLLHRRLQPFRYLHDCSGCFRLERSPGGTCTHWKAPPSHGTRK